MPRYGVVLAGTVAALSCSALAAGPARADTSPEWVRTPVSFTTQTLEFEVPVDNGAKTCNVEADLRIPAGVDAQHPAPAILTSNGFGGSKDSAGTAAANGSYAIQYAAQGYVTLSYSGLGFGHSGCQIELDSPLWDGQAGAALVDFLGGDTSKAYTAYTADQTGLTAGTWTAPYTAKPPVVLDGPDDPRVGMIGGSYGGQNQFAVAAASGKVDAIIPQITWNDLAYSLAPNNQLTGGQTGVTQTEASPGVEKQTWVAAFSALGIAQVGMGNGGPAAGSATCPNFDATACQAIASMNATGYPDQTVMDFAHSASAGTYLSSLKNLPVFLSQGQDDTLFNLREATTTFQTLQALGDTNVKMLWQSWGHSGPSTLPAGETNGESAVPQLFDDLRYSAWFAKYLRNDSSADTGPAFEYYTPWLTGNGSATTPDTAQMTGSATFPVGHVQPLPLAGWTTTADFAVSPDQASSVTEVSAENQTVPITDTPGTFASFESPVLTENADQVGSPTLTVNLSAPTLAVTQATPAGQLVLFAKLYDVAPDGSVTLANRIVSPVRVTDVTKPVTIALPSIVHRYPAGDRLEVVLSSGDSSYKGNNTAAPVSVVSDATHVNTLAVPFTDPDGAVFSAAPPAALPEAGTPLLLVGAGGLAAAVFALRRRRARAA